MWSLLKRLGSECWGQHEWIHRANTRGMWLECRRCGLESAGLELSEPGYRRTQEGADEAHRIGGVAPALRAARITANAAAPVKAAPMTAASGSRHFGVRRAATRPSSADVAASWDATTAMSAVAATDAERRWLQVWRALSPDERAVAERMVAGLTLTRRGVPTTGVPARDGAGEDRLVG